MNIFSFENRWDLKNISLFISLLILPNLLGMINLPTIFGFKIHFFQLAVFLAAVKFGPVGGLASGAVGSFYSTIVMNNPYILAGNMLLGFFTGFFLMYGFSLVRAVWAAFLIQIPYLFVTDYFFMGLSFTFISSLIVALFISNTLWAWIIKNVA